MVNSPGKRHFLDSPYARLAALGCFALSAGALAYVHRADLFPAAPRPAAQTDDAYSRCFRDGAAPIDKMLAEKTIGEAPPHYLNYPEATTGHPADKEVAIRIMDPEGGSMREIDAFNGGQGTINVNSWAPDSRRLAYVTYPVR